jgi:choline kinase
MNAIIVAAGVGKRLREFTDGRPKCLLEVNGATLLERQVDMLMRNGISEINVVVGHKKECFTDNRLRYFTNTEYRNNNILHSLFFAEKAMDQGFYFSYSDIIYEESILKQMLNCSSDIAIAADPNWMISYEGRYQHPVQEAELVFSENGKTVSRILKNGHYQNALGEFLGVAYFSIQGATLLKEIFHQLNGYYSQNGDRPFHTARSFHQAYMTDMFQELIDRGCSVDIVKINGRWSEIDTEEDLNNARRNWI